MDDLISLLIYVLFILGAIITSVYQAKKRKSLKDPSSSSGEHDQTESREENRDFGPFAEFFDRLSGESQTPVYENIENEPSVEKGGMDAEKSYAYEGMASGYGNKMAEPVTNDPNLAGDFTDEGQSDLQKMNMYHQSQPQEFTYDTFLEDIAAGEIVSEEAAAEALSKQLRREDFDWRKGIIYSEILKRKEF